MVAWNRSRKGSRWQGTPTQGWTKTSMAIGWISPREGVMLTLRVQQTRRKLSKAQSIHSLSGFLPKDMQPGARALFIILQALLSPDVLARI